MQFSRLSKLPSKYLSSFPVTSAASEWVFSKAGWSTAIKRNGFKEKKAEEILFFNANLKFLNFDYKELVLSSLIISPEIYGIQFCNDIGCTFIIS